MKLVDTLRDMQRQCSQAGEVAALEAAIARIEAADALFEAVTHRRDLVGVFIAYRALVREQDGGDDA